MRTSAYQQSVSRHRSSTTGSDQLSKSMTVGVPRHRNRVTQPPSPAGADAGVAAAQNSSVPGAAGRPNAAKGLSEPSSARIRSSAGIGASL